MLPFFFMKIQSKHRAAFLCKSLGNQSRYTFSTSYGLRPLLACPLKTLKLPFIVLKTSAPKESKHPKYKMLNGVPVPTG